MRSIHPAAALLAARLFSHPSLALAQDTAATAPLPTAGVTSAALALPPSPEEPVIAQNSAVVEFLRATAGRFPGYYPPSVTAEPATLIHFSSPDPANLDSLQEDLNVMSLLLQKKLEDAVGENSPTYKMGIPLLLRSGQRSIESLYVENFGAVFTVHLNFPLMPPTVAKPKENAGPKVSDDWDKARKELYGGSEASVAGSSFWEGLPYDSEQVGTLKRALFEVLKNASNIRALKPDESVAVTVFGTANVPPVPAPLRASGGGTAGVASGFGTATETHRRSRATVLSVLVKKSDAEQFAKGKLNFDQFQQKVTAASYLGSATPSGGPTWSGASYSGGGGGSINAGNPVPARR